MRIGVLGTGMVGRALAARAAEVGHQVTVGARSADSPTLSAFAELEVVTGSFAEAAAAGDLVINATHGLASPAALALAGRENLAGKTLLDVANELHLAEGLPPRPLAAPDNSLGLRIQREFAEARVVKALHTMTNQVMVHPELVPGDHVAFLSGDDAEAKEEVRVLLRTFGWRDPQFVDLGGIETAVHTEQLMGLWLCVAMGRGWTAPPFNWAIHAVDRPE